eukprot:CAMPEP_0115085448 /NCGR_PEP_ID=MMETSP0227-20121206/21935_1 /TAXON_ID=89957 /ORGANISM="Polarella glacialis, Strain CCMP 1383" /LENGTH=396 /DNA_ID=CAMNT_0002474595 /DNA_START=72 /DNA_END=1262 /DNA_ORIENTATION=+
MAHFFVLQRRMDQVAKNYFTLTQEASDNLFREVEAVTKVQSVYRASKIRKCWFACIGGALLIQRVMRGWLARSRSKALKFERNRRLNKEFFEHCAAVIQKFFRGWWSRRHLHDYHGRKRYLATVEKRGEWTSEYLAREHQEKLSIAKQEEERQMRQEFDNLAGELHHLVSTKTIAGVYNPPYNDTLPRAFEKPIEQHLRDSCRVQMPKSLRRPRHRVAMDSSPRQEEFATAQMGASHAELHAAIGGSVAAPPQELPDRQPHQSRSASVGRMQKVQGPFRSKEQIEVANVKAATIFRTVQASSRYDAVEHDQKMQTRLSKLTRVSPMDFMAPGYPAEKQPPSSVHASVPYRERPVELRNDYLELPKIRDKPPFYTALPMGKHFEEYNEQPLLPNGFV